MEVKRNQEVFLHYIHVYSQIYVSVPTEQLFTYIILELKLKGQDWRQIEKIRKTERKREGRRGERKKEGRKINRQLDGDVDRQTRDTVACKAASIDELPTTCRDIEGQSTERGLLRQSYIQTFGRGAGILQGRLERNEQNSKRKSRKVSCLGKKQRKHSKKERVINYMKDC